MRVAAAARAVAYREVVWFRRFFAENVIMWLLPLLFGLAIVFLPQTVSRPEEVYRKVSMVLGRRVGFEDMILYALSLSALIGLVAACIEETIQVVFNEAKRIGVLQTVLETMSLGSYYAGCVLVKPFFVGVNTTLYLALVLPLVAGVRGLLTYLTLLPIFIACSYALILYSLPIALAITYFARLSRPWVVSNLLTPTLLAGSGLYIPLKLVPWLLRVVAETSPVPETCEALRALILWGSSANLLPLVVSVVCLAVVYTMVTSLLSHVSDQRARVGA